MLGCRVWLDEDNLKHGNIDSAMAEGIEASDVFVACLTKEYIRKVNVGSRTHPLRDNCAKEFNCALIRGKPIVPVVFETAARDSSSWGGGVLTLNLGNSLQIRAVDDDWRSYARSVAEVMRFVCERAVPAAGDEQRPVVRKCLSFARRPTPFRCLYRHRPARLSPLAGSRGVGREQNHEPPIGAKPLPFHAQA